MDAIISNKNKQQGNKNRKYGRNATYCLRYRNEDTHRRNQVKRLKRHMKHFPKDRQAANRLAEIR